jgi:Na+/H+ antiporter NhaC
MVSCSFKSTTCYLLLQALTPLLFPFPLIVNSPICSTAHSPSIGTSLDGMSPM